MPRRLALALALTTLAACGPVAEPKHSEIDVSPAPPVSASLEESEVAEPAAVSDSHAQQLTNELNALRVTTLAALGSGGDGGSVLHDGAALSAALADAQSGTAVSGGGTGQGGTLAGLGNGPGTPPATTPSGMAGVGGAAVTGGIIQNAASVVQGMAAGFRRCYNRGLASDASMAGSLEITAQIGPNGEVVSAAPKIRSGTLTGVVVSCIAARVASAQFAPPDTGGASVSIPVTLSVTP